jgi:aldose sugar dehydrogenase
MVNLPKRSQKSPLVVLNEKNSNRCLCSGCPTYNSSPCPKEKNEWIFCSIGLSDCELEQKGCICGDCQNFKDYSLKVGYFCVKGEAMKDGNPAQPGRGK